jgi:hypothetical protein
MKRRKFRPLLSTSQRVVKLERKLELIEAEMSRLARDADWDLAVQNHFALSKRPALFVGCSSELLQ